MLRPADDHRDLPTECPTSLRKLAMHQRLSLLTLAIGFSLLAYMITVEDEPGAIPLALIVLGSGWYYVARRRGVRSKPR
jgi:hypothetical protein